MTLWTMDGVLIGKFGDSEGWQLGKHYSYASGMSNVIKDDQPWTQHCKYFIPLTSSSNNVVLALADESLPSGGEVWISVSSLLGRISSDVPEGHGEQMSGARRIQPIDVHDMITVIRVSKGEVKKVYLFQTNVDFIHLMTFLLADSMGWK